MAGAEEQSLSSKDDGMWGTWGHLEMVAHRRWWKHQVVKVQQLVEGSHENGGSLWEVELGDWWVAWEPESAAKPVDIPS